MRIAGNVWLVAATGVLAGCGAETTISEPPRIHSVAVAAPAGNVLAAIVSAGTDTADSLIVRYGTGTSGPIDSVTPAVAWISPTTEIPLLGLLPEQAYRVEVAAYRGQLQSVSPAVPFTTGALPEGLPRYEATGVDPSPGYVIFAAGTYLLAIDNTGRVVWYHRLAEGPSLNFMAQPNGRYVARPTTTDPTDQESWIEIDVMGRTTRRLGCAGGMVSRPHDLIAHPDGSWWLFCDDTRQMDLSAIGGFTSAKVTGTAVQHVGALGDLLFHWTPFAHFRLEDIGEPALSSATINWTHGNALDLGPDGTLVVSFRNLSEVTAIDTHTGEVKWRLGGARNEFTFVGTEAPPFASQHGLRLVEDGLLLLDNLGDTRESRAERYRLDVANRTATLVTAYRPSDPVIAQLGGTTQLLNDGHTLVSFGNGGRVEEYDASGRVVWRINGNPGYVFRAQRIKSLYAPGAGNR